MFSFYHFLALVPRVPLIKQLGWLNIQQMIEYETTKIVHKTLHNEIPEYLQGLFTSIQLKSLLVAEARGNHPISR